MLVYKEKLVLLGFEIGNLKLFCYKELGINLLELEREIGGVDVFHCFLLYK